jgi:hypothetical protein
MNTQIIETVTFKLAAGTNETTFREAIPATLDFAAQCPGFVRRVLSQGPEGWWLDHLEWTSLAAADAAGKAFEADPRNHAFMQSIDPATMNMRHSELVVERT